MGFGLGAEVGFGVGVGVRVAAGVAVGVGAGVCVGSGEGVGDGFAVNVAVMVYEAWMLLNVYEVTLPTELPFTKTSAIWYPALGVIVNVWLLP